MGSQGGSNASNTVPGGDSGMLAAMDPVGDEVGALVVIDNRMT